MGNKTSLTIKLNRFQGIDDKKQDFILGMLRKFKDEQLKGKPCDNFELKITAYILWVSQYINQLNEFKIRHRYKGVDYAIFNERSPNLDVPSTLPIVYIFGTNEVLDWPANVSSLIRYPTYQPGYLIRAWKLYHALKKNHKFHEHNPFLLFAHSQGAGIGQAYCGRFKKKGKLAPIQSLLCAPPVAVGRLNFKKQPKTTLFIKRDDIIRATKITPYKYPVGAKKIYLDKTKDDEIFDGHKRPAYVYALLKEVARQEFQGKAIMALSNAAKVMSKFGRISSSAIIKG